MEVKDFCDKVKKVCKLKLSEDDKSSPLWDIVWDEGVSKDELKSPSGRCYFIVVDGEIYKIGYSDCIGGIRKTIDTYRSQGNSGSPSDRTYAIHMFLTEELVKGKKVEFYYQSTEEIEVELTLSTGVKRKILTSISGKNLEIHNVSLYKEFYGEYPVWNTQERNEKYPQYILDGRIDLIKNKKKVTLNEVKGRLKELV